MNCAGSDADDATCRVENGVGGVIELVVDKEDLDSRREKFGFFALFTHCNMTPAEMITVYTSRDLVEMRIAGTKIRFQRLSDNALPCRRWHR
ncbi:MAG: hypothetical protein BA871_13080 [Desulfuromonadales bacterium C00003096]|jgi:hypothetical protein|nr:MAG: hypothetical protein BA871_13080 [Desulfuromonadales bacterium C00003096]